MSDTHHGQPLERLALSLLEVPLALQLAYSTMLAVAWIGCRSGGRSCVDLSGLPWYLGGALLGLVVAVLYWRRAFRLRDRWRQRLLLDAAALILGVAPFVIAGVSDRLHAAPPTGRTQPPPAVSR